MHAEIEHQDANQQFSVLQTPAEYEGKRFTLLIDSGSTHSFVSPKCVRNLELSRKPNTSFTVKIATGKRTKSLTTVGDLKFKLGGHDTHATFRVLPLGIYDGILGMDWLKEHDAIVRCGKASLTFLTNDNQEVCISGVRGKPKLQLVSFSKLLKAQRKK